MMSLEDISAMKINPIVNSGERVKDHIDIFYLLKDMSLDHIFGYYCKSIPMITLIWLGPHYYIIKIPTFPCR